MTSEQRKGYRIWIVSYINDSVIGKVEEDGGRARGGGGRPGTAVSDERNG